MTPVPPNTGCLPEHDRYLPHDDLRDEVTI